MTTIPLKPTLPKWGVVCKGQDQWQVRRFLTLQNFSDAKLAIHGDLEARAWERGNELGGHAGVRDLVSKAGIANPNLDPGTPGQSTGDEPPRPGSANAPALIYEADSSQYRVIADGLSGNSLAVVGPRGYREIADHYESDRRCHGGRQDGPLCCRETHRALKVVNKRLQHANLERFCFNLHSNGIRMAEVRSALQRRMDSAAIPFDAEAYTQETLAWQTQRDALRLYARLMGQRVGNLGDTVHDVMWKAICKREAISDLPGGLNTIPIPNAEHLAPEQVAIVETEIGRLCDAVDELQREDEPRRTAWQGVRRSDLGPLQIDSALDLTAAWREAVGALCDWLRRHDVNPAELNRPALGQLVRALELFGNGERLPQGGDLSRLADPQVMEATVAAATACASLVRSTDHLLAAFGVEADTASPGHYESLVLQATALGCQDESAGRLSEIVKALRDRARGTRRAIVIARQIGELLGLPDLDDAEAPAVDLAVRALCQASREVLLERDPKLTDERSAQRIAELDAKVRATLEQRGQLAETFDLPTEINVNVDELRQAARDLEHGHAPTFLSSRMKQAVKLHQRFRRGSEKLSRPVMADELRQIADHVEAVARLQGDPDALDLFGARWRGCDTNLEPAVAVSEWAGRVARDLAGVGKGHEELRHVLLLGDLKILDEAQNLVGELKGVSISDALSPDPAPEALDERAGRIEELRQALADVGFPSHRKISDAGVVAEALRTYETDLRTVTRYQEVEGLDVELAAAGADELARRAEIATGIRDAGISPSVWRLATQLASPPSRVDGEPLWKELGGQVHKEAEVWQSLVDLLDIDEEEFVGKEADLLTLEKRGDPVSRCPRSPEFLVAAAARSPQPLIHHLRPHPERLGAQRRRPAQVVRSFRLPSLPVLCRRRLHAIPEPAGPDRRSACESPNRVPKAG